MLIVVHLNYAIAVNSRWIPVCETFKLSYNVKRVLRHVVCLYKYYFTQLVSAISSKNIHNCLSFTHKKKRFIGKIIMPAKLIPSDSLGGKFINSLTTKVRRHSETTLDFDNPTNLELKIDWDRVRSQLFYLTTNSSLYDAKLSETTAACASSSRFRAASKLLLVINPPLPASEQLFPQPQKFCIQGESANLIPLLACPIRENVPVSQLLE